MFGFYGPLAVIINWLLLILLNRNPHAMSGAAELSAVVAGPTWVLVTIKRSWGILQSTNALVLAIVPGILMVAWPHFAAWQVLWSCLFFGAFTIAVTDSLRDSYQSRSRKRQKQTTQTPASS